MIDFHCHILWDMDDGADSIEQAVSMASIAADEGIETIIATPHCIEEKDLKGFARRVKERCSLLQERLDGEGLEIRIAPGAELYTDPAFLEMDGLELVTLNNSQYILVELPMGEVPRYTEDFIYHLQLKCLIPIIAHPERNLSIIEDPNIMLRLIDLGALAQINTGSITGLFGSRVQQCAQILLTHGMGHLLGTDAHSDRRRGPYMQEAVRKLREWLEPQQVEAIIYTTPQNIYAGKSVLVSTPTEYHKKKSFFSFLRRKAR